MIRDCLIPALKREFSGWEIIYDAPPRPIATFPAAQDSVGRVMIYDDGDEATLLIEKITHHHFNPYDASLSEAERDRVVAEDVVDFLKALFSDRVLLNIHENGRSAGCMRLDTEDGPVELSPSHRYFLWTRPYDLPLSP